MQLIQYNSQQLNNLLQSPPSSNFSGVLSLETTVNSWHKQKYCELVLYNGKIVYGGEKIPDRRELARSLGEKLNPHLINAALSIASQKTVNPNSVRELLEILIKIRVFTWEQAEAFIKNQVVIILEKFASFPGTGRWESITEFDLSYGEDRHGLDWAEIKQDLAQRQQQWNSLATVIPGMNAIPQIDSKNFRKITDRRIKEHLKQYADGKKTLIDIAEATGKDPLIIAKFYSNWVNSGFVTFQPAVAIDDNQTITTPDRVPDVIEATNNSGSLATILSVDDSPIIQVSIKRALRGSYNVLLASNATDALDILNQQSVQLLLLDLTMPDVDGLDFCRTIRKIPKFQDLPIIMVTARDGLIDRMKGQIAGTNKYLTKPFKSEELQAMVDKYVYVRS